MTVDRAVRRARRARARRSRGASRSRRDQPRPHGRPSRPTSSRSGEIVKAQIVRRRTLTDRRITLSLKKAELENLEALKFDENRGARDSGPERKVGPSGGGGATLGDVLKAKLGDLAVASDDSASSDDESSDSSDSSDSEDAAEDSGASDEEE